MHIEQVSPAHAEVADMICQLEKLLAGLYPPESNHMDQVEELQKAKAFMVGAFDEGILVGIGAVKILVSKDADKETYGEIKRVFVGPAHRGKGVSKLIMTALENHLRENHVRISRLETGIAQPEALGLYKNLGYVERDPYGGYRPDPLSVFMEKKLFVD